MKIYFFRHGETVEWSEWIILGTLPGTLSEKGKSDIHALAKRLSDANIPFDAIISSDLQRALDTAKIFSQEFGLPIETHALMRERAAGASEGKKEDEIAWEAYERKPFPYRKHLWGESFFDVKKRAKAFLESTKRMRWQNAIAISHSVFIGMVYAQASGVSMRAAVKIKPEKGVPVYDTENGTMKFVPLDTLNVPKAR